jgi:hypothetical protein
MARPRKTSPALYRCIESFFANLDGISYQAIAGVTTVEEGSPLLENYPQWFAPFQPDHKAAVTSPPDPED